MLCVRTTVEKGRRVFAQGPFAAGQVIESAPVIILPGKQWKLIAGTTLKDYHFY